MDSSTSSKMTLPRITIRAAIEIDIKSIICFLKELEPRWARVEWYLQSLIEEYPGCIQLAENSEREICGLAGGIPLTSTEGYFTHFLVKKDLRGRGIGRMLLDSALQFLGERNILLLATPDGNPVYTRRGFQTCCDTLLMLRGQISKEWIDTIEETVDDLEIRNMKKIKVDDVINYNKDIQGIKEEWLFRRHISQRRDVVGKAAILNNQLVGFSYLLISSSSCPILTLYADTTPIAKLLLKSLYKMLDSHETEPWDFTVPNGNKKAVDMFYQFENDKLTDWRLTAMYTKCRIPVSWDRIYATHANDYHFA